MKFSCQNQTLIAVNNVQKSSRWYQKVLNCKSGHGGNEYEQIVVGERMILQLHAWGAHQHGFLGKKSIKSRGNGVVLWFLMDDFDAALKRIKTHKVKVLEPVKINTNASHREIWIQDPDGYVVVLASHYE